MEVGWCGRPDNTVLRMWHCPIKRGCGIGQPGEDEDVQPANQGGISRHAANEKPTIVSEAAALANQGKVEDVDCVVDQSGEVEDAVLDSSRHVTNDQPTVVAEAANQRKVEDFDCIDQSGEVEDAVLDSPRHVTNDQATVVAEAAKGPGIRC